jgi:glycosyltransferase involved in cell wall biosynthesis
MSTPSVRGNTPAVRQRHHAGSHTAKVAVIVPCYNAEPCLKRALDSAFAQSYTNFRVYAVDDGSTDGTREVLETYGERCSSISQTHAGAAAARNRAIQLSDAPYIAFLDADDEWMPQKLERQVALMEQDPSLGLVCSVCAIRGFENNTHSVLSAPGPRAPGKLFERLVRDGFVITPSVVVRRRCLDEIGLFHESLGVCEDFNLWLRIAARWRIALLPQVLAIVHKRAGSLSATISPKERLRNGVVALQDVQSRCPDLSAAENRALRKALAQRMYFYGSFLLAIDGKTAARRELSSALRLDAAHSKAAAKLLLSFLPSHISDLLSIVRTKLTNGSLSKQSPEVRSTVVTADVPSDTKQLRISP